MADAALNTARDRTPVRKEFVLTDDDFARIRRFIYRRAGISIGDHKREMVYSRLARLLRNRNLSSFTAYLDIIERGTDGDLQEFVNALTTNLTSFFREPHHFPILAEKMRSAAAKRGIVNIWTCASSTGEEAWSLAMTAVEAFGTAVPPVRILATDIDTVVLEKGRRGIYPRSAVERLDTARLKRFFQRGTGKNEGFARISADLRGLVTFAPLNLLADEWTGIERYDAIFCRNVMIYFDRPTQRRLLERFLPLLHDEGLLFAGHSESFFHAADLFKSCGKTVYRKSRG